MKYSNTTFLAFICFIILCNGIYEVCGVGTNASTGKRKASATKNIVSTDKNEPEYYTADMCIEYLTKSLGGNEEIMDIIKFLLYEECPNFLYAKYDLIGRQNSNDLTKYIQHIINTINDNEEKSPELKIDKVDRKYVMRKLEIRGMGAHKLGIINALMFSIELFKDVCGVGNNDLRGKRKASAIENTGSTDKNVPEKYTVEMCIEYLKKSLGGNEEIMDIIKFLLYEKCPNFVYAKNDKISMRKSNDLSNYIQLIINTLNDNEENSPELKVYFGDRKNAMIKLGVRGKGDYKLGLLDGLMYSMDLFEGDENIDKCKNIIFEAVREMNIANKIKRISEFCLEKARTKDTSNNKPINKNFGSGSETRLGTGGLDVDRNNPAN